VIIAEEVDKVLDLFHYSLEKGAHAGRDSMMNKISKLLNYLF
jgi:hypothetical protein